MKPITRGAMVTGELDTTIDVFKAIGEEMDIVKKYGVRIRIKVYLSPILRMIDEPVYVAAMGEGWWDEEGDNW